MDEENLPAASDERNNNNTATAEKEDTTTPPPSKEITRKKRNINSYYGSKIGFLHTLSLTLNAGLMIYAHVGLSAVILSSRDPSITANLNLNANSNVVDNDVDGDGSDGSDGSDVVEDNDAPTTMNNGITTTNNNITSMGKCNTNDTNVWIDNGGEFTRANDSNYCSRSFGCFLDVACIEECFETEFGYSSECSTCFGSVPGCSVASGCLMVCAADSLGPDCRQCNVPCVEELHECTGLPEVNETITTTESFPGDNTENNDTATLPQQQPDNAAVGSNACNAFDLDAIEEWYNVYDLTFVRSINDAWNGDAKLLAVIIVLFSGIWPYLKNVILVIIWYLPATIENQTSVLLWLSRLSKYTLVDVFAVIGVLVGVQLQLDVGGTEAVTRAEPRFGIIAFFLATVWEFLQIELVKAMHERNVVVPEGRGSNNTDEKDEEEEGATTAAAAAREETLFFSQRYIPLLLLAASLALYVSGAVNEIVYFESTDTAGTCKRSYNLVTLGNALIDKASMTDDNSSPGQTWILYWSYVVLNLIFPILVLLLQFVFLVGWFGRSEKEEKTKMKSVLEWMRAVWCFACIEVLLIGIFAVEYKFPNLIMKIAGDSNAGFLDIDSGLGSGFYILIAYAVATGFLQLSLRIRTIEKDV